MSCTLLPPERLPRLFFAWEISLGLLYCFLNPPFAVNDERAHLPRVQELAAGGLLTRTDSLGPHYLVPEGDRSRIVKYSNLRNDVAIFALMYATDTPVGASTVNGVQGRYFLPLAPAYFAALTVLERPVLSNWLTARSFRRIVPAVAALNAATLLTIVARYYVPL